MIWVASQTWPDVGFDVCQLSAQTRCTKVEDILEVNKVVKRLHSRTYSLFYPILRDKEDLVIDCFSDASFANLSDGGSQGGYILFLADRHGERLVISWKSRKVRRVVKSTTAAETLALLECGRIGCTLFL